MSEKLYTCKEVAEMFGVTLKTVSRWIAAGRLRVMRLTAKNYRISQSAIDDFVKQR